MGKNKTIYISLLNEGIPTARPTEGVELEENTFKILPTPDYNSENEEWEFLPGSIVHCEKTSGLFGEMLLAVRQKNKV